MKKRVIALTLAMLMLAVTVPVMAVGPELGDIAGLACEEAVSGLAAFGIVAGYPDGTFKPEGTLTRAEAAKLMAAAGLLAGESGSNYPDAQGHWAVEYIGLCDQAGIVQGYEAGAFMPESPVTWQELALMCQRLTGYDDDGAAARIPKGTDPAAAITRGDAAVMLFHGIQTILAGSEKEATLYTSHAVKSVMVDKPLQPFALAGHVTEGQINAVELDGAATVYGWEAVTGQWYVEAAPEYTYSYVALYGAEAADTILVVAYDDGPAYWDAQAGVDFAGTYSIPYGQRQIDAGIGGAADDYSNIVASGDLIASTYWPTYDWYNTTSTETLTFLTGFKTTQQTTGWACGTTSALMALDWYSLRGDLNELDLSTLRDKVIEDEWKWGGYTDTQMLVNIFTNLNTRAGEDVWAWESVYDFLAGEEFDFDTYLSTDWIKGHLSQGHPILVGWNSFGGHWQVIIGYDDMGTESTADDVLILADPYDTTDHLNDGYNIQSYERLYWDYTQDFDRDFGQSQGYGFPVAFVPYPTAGFEWEPVQGDGLAVKSGAVWARTGNTAQDMVIPFGDTADDLDAADYPYSKDQRGENGLAGPASSDWYRKADVEGSPYYAGYDFFRVMPDEVTPSLRLLTGFQTAQQASEWTCGPASLRMALNYYNQDSGDADLPSEFALAALRSDDKEGATTLDGMIEMLEGLNSEGGDWVWLSTDDLDDDWNIAGTQQNLEGGFVPWCLRHGIPVLVGWDEWGGHWMVIIGYDDMGTEATQDDVIILADPYDTTDHCQDGYVIESWERLIYGWGASFDERGSEVFLAFGPQAHFAEMGLPTN